MRSVTYSMGVSLDGYIVGPDGGFEWTAPPTRPAPSARESSTSATASRAYQAANFAHYVLGRLGSPR
jgi:hypothetical protein